VPASPRLVRRIAGKDVHSESVTETSETSVDSQKVTGGFPPEPSESAIHGREVHVAKQKQTQKEVCTHSFFLHILQRSSWHSAVVLESFLKSLLNYLHNIL